MSCHIEQRTEAGSRRCQLLGIFLLLLVRLGHGRETAEESLSPPQGGPGTAGAGARVVVVGNPATGIKYSLGRGTADLRAAQESCWSDTALAQGVLVPAAHMLAIMAANMSALEGALKADAASSEWFLAEEGRTLWTLDPYGGCRAATLLPSPSPSGPSTMELRVLPCASELQYMCMPAAALKQLEIQDGVRYPPYFAPPPYSKPPSPYMINRTAVGSAYEFPVVTPLRLSTAQYAVRVPPINIANMGGNTVGINATAGLKTQGPIINIVGSWTAEGLVGIRIFRDNNGSPTSAASIWYGIPPGNGTPPFASEYHLPREPLNDTMLRTSFITRVEGCASATAIQRLVFYTAGGAVVQQGSGVCTTNFAEEATEGGYLGDIQMWFYPDSNSSAPGSRPPKSIMSMAFCWTYVEGDLPKGYPLKLFPDLVPRLPVPACSSGRTMLLGNSNVPTECGVKAPAQYCPSFACCGSDGMCGTTEQECKEPGCDPRYGLCGVVPEASLVFTGHEGVWQTRGHSNESSTMRAPETKAPNQMSPLRRANVIYVINTTASVSYVAAEEYCRDLKELSLQWELINATDALAFEVSVLTTLSFAKALAQGEVWLESGVSSLNAQSRSPSAPYGSSLAPAAAPSAGNKDAPTCLTASFTHRPDRLRLSRTRTSSCAGGSAARVVCRAAWPFTTYGETPALPADDTKPTSPVRFVPGAHTLLVDRLLGNRSTDECTFSSIPAAQSRWYNLTGSLFNQTKPPIITASPPTDMDLQFQVCAIGLRPLLAWYPLSKEVSADNPLSYQAVSAMTVRYAYNRSGYVDSPPSDENATTTLKDEPDINKYTASGIPVILGPRDGTWASGEGKVTYILGPTETTDKYFNVAKGWHWLELNTDAKEVVTAVAGCRGAVLERVVLTTSLGRTWSVPLGNGGMCTSTFRVAAPTGGYLVALEVHAGNYIEQLEVVWGVPTNKSKSPALGKEEMIPKSAFIGLVVGSAVGAVLLAVLVTWCCLWCVRSGRWARWRAQRAAKAAGGSGAGSWAGGCADDDDSAGSGRTSMQGPHTGSEMVSIIIGPATKDRPAGPHGLDAAAALDQEHASSYNSSAAAGGESSLVKVSAAAHSTGAAAVSAAGGDNTAVQDGSADNTGQPLPDGDHRQAHRSASGRRNPAAAAAATSIPSPSDAGTAASTFASRTRRSSSDSPMGGVTGSLMPSINSAGEGTLDGSPNPAKGLTAAAEALAAGQRQGAAELPGGAGNQEHREQRQHEQLFQKGLWNWPTTHGLLQQHAAAVDVAALGTAALEATGSEQHDMYQLLAATAPGRNSSDGAGTAGLAGDSAGAAPAADGGSYPGSSGSSSAAGSSAPPAPPPLLLGRDVALDLDDPSTYLGHGTSGVVRRGQLRQPDGSWRPVAVKLLNSIDGGAELHGRLVRTLVQEMAILGQLKHPNVVQLIGGCLQAGSTFLVEELCGKALSHAVYDAETPYSLQLVLQWCRDIAAGLSYLHPSIVHRDLKPSNVLLALPGEDEQTAATQTTAKISDFGLARFKAHTTLNTREAEVGTVAYMAPECFVSSDIKVTDRCDVYSLGVLMCELATRSKPWSGVRSAVIGFKVAVVGERPELPPLGHPMCPDDLRQLIQECWAQKPDDRPASRQVLQRLEVMLANASASGMSGEASPSSQ